MFRFCFYVSQTFSLPGSSIDAFRANIAKGCVVISRTGIQWLLLCQVQLLASPWLTQESGLQQSANCDFPPPCSLSLPFENTVSPHYWIHGVKIISFQSLKASLIIFSHLCISLYSDRWGQCNNQNIVLSPFLAHKWGLSPFLAHKWGWFSAAEYSHRECPNTTDSLL